MSADNQQGSPLVNLFDYDPSETTRRAPSLRDCKAYLLGASHDGTLNNKHKTFRFSQKSKLWLLLLQRILDLLGYRSWIYREGRSREVYVLETTAKFLISVEDLDFSSNGEKIAYVRGYFDSEGGVPHSLNDRFYIQICQKNYGELEYLKKILKTFGIDCGKIHNPSKRVDPNYWRFYVLSRSHFDFMKKISSWHPLKSKIFQERMKI